MKAAKLLFGMLLLSTGVGASTATPAFYQGKTLAHTVISGARHSSAILVFIQENQAVKGYYCFCSKEDQSVDHLPHLLGTFPDATIESVFYADVDSAGQVTLVLSKSQGKFALRAWRYMPEGTYIPVLQLQPVLDTLVRNNKDLNSTFVKRALGKLPPYDYSAEYPKSDNADFDQTDYTQGKIVGWYLDSGVPSTAAKQPADGVFFYKKTFDQKDGLFLTATYMLQEPSETSDAPIFRVTSVSWQSNPAKFSGSENGPYVNYLPEDGLVKGFYKNGIASGKWATYSQRYETSGNFVDGQQEGQWTIGTQEETASGMMKNSQREGRWTITDGVNGETPEMSGFDTYQHNQRNGPSERRLAGVLLLKGNYVDDQRDGVWIAENGEGSYVKGIANGVWKLKTGDGEIQQVQLTGGKKQGELRWSDKNGQLMQVINYKDDVPDGVYQKYNPAGKRVYQADYVQGKLNGHEIEYYDDGVTLRADRSYRNGELDGPYIYNYADGKPQSVSTFVNGREIKMQPEETPVRTKTQ